MILFHMMLAYASINVGVDDSYPFSYKENGEWTGVSVDLFADIAARNNWDIKYVEIPTAERDNALNTGLVDVYIPAVTITAKREKSFDFSHAYFKDYLAITTHDSGSFWNYIKAFITKSLSALKIMIPVLMTVAAIYYWFEKRSVFSGWGNEIRDYFDSIYWAQTTAATVGYGDEAPKTFWGRITAIIWMLLGIMFFSWVITQLNVTTSQEITSSSIPDQLVAVSNTTCDDYLKSLGVQYSVVSTDTDLRKSFEKGLNICNDKSLIMASLPSANILTVTEKPQYYGFIFPTGSPYVEATNQGLLSVLESSKWKGIRARHLQE